MSVLTPAIEELLREPEYRIEGPLKVRGAAPYTGDVRLPGMLWARFLLSPYPHARIVRIDTSAAKRVPGVHAVVTSEDIGHRRFGRGLCDWPVLAFERVLYIGERVAGVAAETREAAEDAVALIEVDYEELPAVFDVEEALTEGAPLLHPDPSGYRFLSGNRPPRPHLNLQSYTHAHKGEDDIERSFDRAFRIFEDVYIGPGQHQGHIEPHACVVWIDPDETVRIYSTNKTPFPFRHQLAVATGVEDERIVVDSMFIGGDFGGKGHSIDDFPCYYLARATGRPIKAVMTYTEELTAANPRHGARIYVRTGVDREGRLIAHQARMYYDGGAYAGAKASAGVQGSPLQCYAVPNTDIQNFCVYTNTVPRGQMRAPGATIAALAGEEHVDHIARELGIDPLEFRLLNVIREGDPGPTGVKIKDPRGVEVLELLRRETNWGKKPLPPHHGRGISLRHRGAGGGRTGVLLRLMPEGKIEALYGTPDQGSGSAMVVRRVAAAVLSVEPERIVVRYGNTAEALFDPGAGNTRVTNIVGHATIKGATQLKEKLEELASEVMGWPAGQVRLEGGRFLVADGSAEAASFEAVTARILRGGPLELAAEYDSAEPGAARIDETSFYAYMIEVEVDPDTGQVKPIEAVMALDDGVVINPIAHRGQLDGGFVYGLGNATMEELVFEDGRVTTTSLGEYKLPTQMDVPPFRILRLPPAMGPGPFGAKAVGDTTNSGVTPAIANAIYDAVGVRIQAHPFTAERVYEAIQEKRASSS